MRRSTRGCAPNLLSRRTFAKTDKLIKRVGGRLRGANNTECENSEFEFHLFPLPGKPQNAAARKLIRLSTQRQPNSMCET
jgi:hypothetical protein